MLHRSLSLPHFISDNRRFAVYTVLNSNNLKISLFKNTKMKCIRHKLFIYFEDATHTTYLSMLRKTRRPCSLFGLHRDSSIAPFHKSLYLHHQVSALSIFRQQVLAIITLVAIAPYRCGREAR